MQPEQILQWESLVADAVALGVKSWDSIHALLMDAGVDEDDAAIADLETKFNVLWEDVNRAAGN